VNNVNRAIGNFRQDTEFLRESQREILDKKNCNIRKEFLWKAHEWIPHSWVKNQRTSTKKPSKLENKEKKWSDKKN
jgi:hypothetical protein